MLVILIKYAKAGSFVSHGLRCVCNNGTNKSLLPLVSGKVKKSYHNILYNFEFCSNAYLKLETIKSDLHRHSLMQLLPHNSVRESEVMLNTTCVYRWNDFLVSILHQLSGSQE